MLSSTAKRETTKNQKWDETTIKSRVKYIPFAKFALQHLTDFQDQYETYKGKTGQHNEEGQEQGLTQIKDLADAYKTATRVQKAVEIWDKANKLHSKLLGMSTLEIFQEIVQDDTIANHANQCFEDFNYLFRTCMASIKNISKTKQYGREAVEQCLTKIEGLDGLCEKVDSVKEIIAILENREKLDSELLMYPLERLQKIVQDDTIANHADQCFTGWKKQARGCIDFIKNISKIGQDNREAEKRCLTQLEILESAYKQATHVQKAIETWDKANKLHSELSTYSLERIVQGASPFFKDLPGIVKDDVIVKHVEQCFTEFKNQYREYTDLVKSIKTTGQDNIEEAAVEQCLTKIEGLVGAYEQATCAKEFIETSDKVNKFLLEVSSKEWWNKAIIENENIVGDEEYLKYTHQCFESLKTQLVTTASSFVHSSQYRSNSQLLTDLIRLRECYDKAIDVNKVFELVQARKEFQEKRTPETALAVRKALEKFEPPQHLIDDHEKRLNDLANNLIKKAIISDIKDVLMREAMGKIINNRGDSDLIEQQDPDGGHHMTQRDLMDREPNRDELAGKAGKSLVKWVNIVSEEIIAKDDQRNAEKIFKEDLRNYIKEYIYDRKTVEYLTKKIFKTFTDEKDLLDKLKNNFPSKTQEASTSSDLSKLIIEEAVDHFLKNIKLYSGLEEGSLEAPGRTPTVIESKDQKNTNLENLDKEFITPNNTPDSIDDEYSLIKLEIANTPVLLTKAHLREWWSQKEWFSELQMLNSKQIEEIMKEYVKLFMKDLDKKAQDLAPKERLRIKIRCRAKNLIKILKGGRFKSQFETNTSDGILNQNARAISEYGWAGIPLNMPKPFRFIYGYATTDSNSENHCVRPYGDVDVLLKLELNTFALQTLEDSLFNSNDISELYCRPTFFDNVDRRCFTTRGNINPFEIKNREDLEKKLEYQEVQIVGVHKEDIQEVHFYEPMKNKELINILKRMGIPYRCIQDTAKRSTALAWLLCARQR